MREHLKEIVEALVFISVEPLTPARIRSVVEDATEEEIKAALDALKAEYDAGERGIRLISTAGGCQFATKPAYDPQVRRLLQIERKSRLSRAALETLSIVAYHQPVTQAEVNALRNVADSTFTLHTLLQKKLIKISGRKRAPGNPLLYKTSDDFLIYFGLNDLSELPSQEEITKLLEEQEGNNGGGGDSRRGEGGESGAKDIGNPPSVEGQSGDGGGESDGTNAGESVEEEEEEEEEDDDDDDDDSDGGESKSGDTGDAG
jgi:segregation and condensation protein B